MLNSQQKWIVALTGASGMRYALRFLNLLSSIVSEVHLIISEAGLRVLNEEEQIKLSFSSLNSKSLLGADLKKIYFYNPKDIGAIVASGSAIFDGMVVVPCSMGTLAAIANGTCENLIHRAADVTLKESRKLIIVPRETPLSAIHLENMLKLSRMNVRILPAMPGFYHQPSSIEDLVDMLVMKILDQMGLHQDLVERWGSKSTNANKLLHMPLAKHIQLAKSPT